MDSFNTTTTANATPLEGEKAVLVGLIGDEPGAEARANEYIGELEFLAETAGAQTERKFFQKLAYPNPRTFVGKGKLEEIARFIEDQGDVTMAIFDDDLTSKQVVNIERELKVKILDRTSLILDIFAKHARTANAKTQVELAQYQYLLPRLTRMWTHLERQRGGIGMRGPGETQIETDRRIILQRISWLKEQLRDIDKQKVVQRKNRGKLTRVALVGYTNVGKSTLMNLLAKSEVLAENKLFATLDTTVRKVVIDNLPFLLTDTVGFIRKLPTHLVDSFKSTLDEVREADLLVHVVDISHPNYEEQIKVVDKTLGDICTGQPDKPMILVFNKIDAYRHVEKDTDDLTERTAANIPLTELEEAWERRLGDKGRCVFVSAKTGEGIDRLRSVLYDEAKRIHVARFPYNDFLYQTYEDLQNDDAPDIE